MLPSIATIFIDRAQHAKTTDDIEKIVKDLGGHLHDGALTPDNNLDDEPMAFYKFSDDSKAGVCSIFDDHGEIKGWHAWDYRETRSD